MFSAAKVRIICEIYFRKFTFYVINIIPYLLESQYVQKLHVLQEAWKTYYTNSTSFFVIVQKYSLPLPNN